MMGQQRRQQDSTREGDILRMCPEIYLLPSSSLPDQTTEHLPLRVCLGPCIGVCQGQNTRYQAGIGSFSPSFRSVLIDSSSSPSPRTCRHPTNILPHVARRWRPVPAPDWSACPVGYSPLSPFCQDLPPEHISFLVC